MYLTSLGQIARKRVPKINADEFDLGNFLLCEWNSPNARPTAAAAAVQSSDSGFHVSRCRVKLGGHFHDGATIVERVRCSTPLLCLHNFRGK